MTLILTRMIPVLFGLLFLTQPICFAQSESPTTKSDYAQKIETLVEAFGENEQFNGSVLVAKDGIPIVRKGIGMANMEWEIPNSPKTKFRIGSVTKQFTGALILQLVEEGKVKLDEPITTYLPGYRKDTGARFTVHHLLNHTSGVPSYTTDEFFEKHSRDSYQLDDFIKRFASGDLEFEPGSRFSYSNSGYHLLGAIIESAGGESYADALNNRILKPLGMSDSGFDDSAIVLRQRAQGYSKTADGYVNANYLDMGIPYSAGSMYSTVDDLFLWDRALYGDKILSAKSKQLMFEPGMGNYGYGIVAGELTLSENGQKLKTLEHGGGINGFNCHFTRVFEQNQTVIVLDNVGLGRYHRQITQAIVNILNDQPFELPRKSLLKALRETAINDGGSAAVALYRKLRIESPDEYDFEDEEALNELGYSLMGSGKVDDAIELFKLNIEMFPSAFNPYDSLGEAYLAAGDKELALKNYRKSIELNPDNAGGRLAIQKIEGTALKVDAKILQTYAGTYELRPGMEVVMRVENGDLIAKPGPEPEVILEPTSETSFVDPNVKANIEFTTGDDGKVTGLIFRLSGREIKANKIK